MMSTSDEICPLSPDTIRVQVRASLIDLWRPSQIVYSLVGQVIETPVIQTRFEPGDWVIGFGPLASQVTLPVSRCLAIPALNDEISVGLALSISVLQCVRSAKIRLGKSVAVLGYGLVGQLVVQIARLSGAMPITVFSPDGSPNITKIWGQDDPHVKSQVLKTGSIDPSSQADILIDTLGDLGFIQAALNRVRPRGRVLLMANNYPSRLTFDFYPEIHKRSIHFEIRSLDWHLADDKDYQQKTNFLEAVCAFFAANRLFLSPFVQEIAVETFLSYQEYELNVGPDRYGLILRWPTKSD